MPTAGPFIIKELTGNKREITLVGRALPYRPFTLRTKQRMEVTWLPGSPQGTATLLGSKEVPTVLRGMWKTKYLNTAFSGDTPPFQVDNRPILLASEAVEIFDDICRVGSLLRVSWLTTVRIGFLEDFEKSWDNYNDVGWSMDFTWVARDEPIGAATFNTFTSMGDVGGSMFSAFDLLDSIRLPINFGLLTSFTNQLVGFVNGIQNLIYNLEDQIASAVRSILAPVRAVKGLISILGSISAEADLMAAYLDSTVSSTMNGTNPVGSQSPEEKLEAERYRQEMKAWAKFMKSQANENAQQLSTQVDGDILATYAARAGEDLRDVSKKYYNTPYEWQRIMLFNNLSSAELTAGQIVLIPKPNPGQGIGKVGFE